MRTLACKFRNTRDQMALMQARGVGRPGGGGARRGAEWDGGRERERSSAQWLRCETLFGTMALMRVGKVHRDAGFLGAHDAKNAPAHFPASLSFSGGPRPAL